MTGHFYRFAMLCVFTQMIVACGGGGSGDSAPAAQVTPPTPMPLAKGERILEIDVNQASDNDFAAAFNLANKIGMQSATLSLDWTLIDIGTNTGVSPTAPIFQTDPDLNFLAIANACYPNSNTRVSLTLRPITTLVTNLPDAISTLPFNDAAVIDRFKALIDFVYTQIPDLNLTSLVIGSEVDLNLTSDSQRSEYLEFYQSVSQYARDQYALLFPARPPLKISVEVTHRGLLDSATQTYYQQLNQSSDVIGVSYYPLQNGMVELPTIVHSDFDSLTALYPGKQLYFYQLGYPSGYYDMAAYAEYAAGNTSPMIGSSDLMQADFVGEVFSAWDEHINDIGLIDFTWLNDLSEAGVAETTADPAFGGTTNPAPEFVEFLRTLGLRTNAGLNGAMPGGSDKAAFSRLAQEASSRGWNDTGQVFTCL